MSKTALYIPRPGATYGMSQRGYVDALRATGWIVYVCDPKTKLGTRELIEKHNVQLIMSSSRYGIRQLPIDVINDRKIAVIVSVLPFDAKGGAHTDEIAVLDRIGLGILHTHLQPDVWSIYLGDWVDAVLPLTHLPMAGNIVRALPMNCNPLTDVAIVANLDHRPVVTRKLLIPLFRQLDCLGHTYQIFGNELWNQTGLSYSGPLSSDKLAQVYATAKVCPNVHTQTQSQMGTSVNERLFTIPLCGGYQVVNNALAAEYLGEHVAVATKTVNFIDRTLAAINDAEFRFAQIRGAMERVANSHTYFNRLTTIFHSLGWIECCKKTEIVGRDIAVKHCWEMNTRLSCVERGVQYGEKAVV